MAVELTERQSSGKPDANNGKADAELAASPPATMGQLFEKAGPTDVVLMIIGSTAAFLGGVSIPLFNILFGVMLDNINSNPDKFDKAVNDTALIFAIVGGISLFIGAVQIYAWTIAGERQAQRFREDYVDSILRQEIGWFDINGATDLAPRVADLCGKIQDGMGRKFGEVFQFTTQAVACLLVAFYFQWQLTLVLLAAIPGIALAGMFMINAVTAASAGALEQYNKAGGLATEALSSFRTVSALNAQPTILKRYQVHVIEAMNIGVLKGLKLGIGHGGLFCACFMAYALGFWYGGVLVANDLEDGCEEGGDDDCVSGGTILSVFFCVIMGSIALGQIAPPLGAVTTARVATAEILKITRRKPEIDGLSTEGHIPDTHVSGKIEFRNINFSYPSRPDALICNNYNLSIRAGETVALCGSSGAGKSTVANLLLRFYDPSSGTVLVDDVDITGLNTRWLRSQVGYVGQEPVLFSGTVADNISCGMDMELERLNVRKKSNSDNVDSNEVLYSAQEIRERVIAAAKQANAHDFISTFPDGYDTDVGSSGASMSGGQKQRIAIARALIKKPPILILDEATSALDSASERVVQEAIDSLQASKAHTCIIIAHRLSTIRNADKIVVVEAGQVAEFGSHDELISDPSSKYTKLVKLQVATEDDIDATAEYVDEVAVVVENKIVVDLSDVDTGLPTKSGRSRTYSKISELSEGEAKPADIDAEKLKSENSLTSKRVWALIRQHKGWTTIAVLSAMCFGAVFPLWGALLARAQANFFLSNPHEIRVQAGEIGVGFAILGVVSLFSAGLMYWGVAQVGENISAELRSSLFESYLRREVGFFDKTENGIGSLTTRLSDDSRMIYRATGEALAKQLQALCTFLVALIIGFIASWKIALVVLSTFPITIIASAVQMQALTGESYDNKKSGLDHGAVISTAFNNMRTVCSYSLQYDISGKYAVITRKVSSDRQQRSLQAGLGFGGSQMSMFCTYALLFWYGATLIKSGEINFEQLMTAMMALMLGAFGLGTALGDVGDQALGMEAAKRVFSAIDEAKKSPTDGLSSRGAKPAAKCVGKIEFRNVFFSYPTRKKMRVCKDYSITIEPGETVAFVGSSGSGKSTIMSLLLRFYDPDKGSIFLDGVDTKDINVRWLRSQIGYVGQEPVLFSGNVEENIDMGNTKDLSDEELLTSFGELVASQNSDMIFGTCASRNKVVHDEFQSVEEAAETGAISSEGVNPAIVDAAKSSNAHSFIVDFPNGYHTEVGASGTSLISGGQKQRIAIARALIKNPSILLLDEATSALDSVSERVVQEAIDALQAAKSRTTLVIAHRLSTIRNADKIVVVEHGRVAEVGRHEELLQKPDGLYKKLWMKQQDSGKQD